MKIYSLFNCNNLNINISQLVENGLNIDLSEIPVFTSLESMANTLDIKRRFLFDMSIDDIIGILDKVGKLWRDSSFSLRKIAKDVFIKSGQYSEEMIELSFKYMCDMYEKGYLEGIADNDLFGNRKVLDEYTKLQSTTPIKVKAVPRGIAGHWLSGNTLIIGQISLLRAILTKNASIIKVSSKNKVFLPLFLESFKYVEYTNSKGEFFNGEVLASCISVIYFDSKDEECNKELSKYSNIRVARGGRKAIEAIMNTKKGYGTEDVIYGPKYSMIAIGRECLSGEYVEKLIKNASIDFSIWDQFACTSPHVIFAEKGGDVSVKEFSKKLAIQMELLEDVLPNKSIDNENAPAIVAARIENEFDGITYCKESTAWSVLYNEDVIELPKPLFSRVVRVIAVEDISKIYSLIDKYIQTMAIAMEGDKRKEFINECTYRGVERCVPVGLMHTMLPGSPWDGFFNCDRLVRWVSCFDEVSGPVNEKLIIDC